MIRWLMCGLLRDKTRSLFPWSVVTVGVALMIFLLGYLDGIFQNMIDMIAKLDTGHLRLVNRAFYEEEYLNPLDRALAGQMETRRWLEQNGDPRIQWVPRIRWSAILDVPDERGETRTQTPVIGLAADLLSADSPERRILRLKEALIRGRLPSAPHEMIAGYLLAETLGLNPGDTVTLIGQSFDGGLATDNYTVSGFIRFGVFAQDKKMALIDLNDARQTFYMEDMVTDWLGFLPIHVAYSEYNILRDGLRARLGEWLRHPPKAWAEDDRPIVLSIMDQRNMAAITRTFEITRGVIVGIFTLIMVLVLWNAALLNGIHRYGEMGLRLALGESHKELVGHLMIEAVIVGAVACVSGSLIGGSIVYYLQEVGVNMGDAFAQTGLMLADVSRGRVSPEAFIYGIVPGMAASVCGTLAACMAVFRRSEANLFRELEVG